MCVCVCVCVFYANQTSQWSYLFCTVHTAQHTAPVPVAPWAGGYTHRQTDRHRDEFLFDVYFANNELLHQRLGEMAQEWLHYALSMARRVHHIVRLKQMCV